MRLARWPSLKACLKLCHQAKQVLIYNLRYEDVEQDNALDDASALTLRTLLAYDTGSYKGFSAKIEMEDTRIVLGQGDYTVGPSGYKPGSIFGHR